MNHQNNNPKESSFQQAVALLKRSQKILLLVPKNWTGDHISSLFAFYLLLSRLGKEIVAIGQESVPDKFSFLGDTHFLSKNILEKGDFVLSLSTRNTKVDRIKYTINEDSVDIFVSPVGEGRFSPDDVSFRQSVENFDLILCLGIDQLEDLGEFFDLNPELFASSLVLNFSNSVSNTYFGKINCVDPLKSSLSEMIFDLIESDKTFQSHLDVNLATMLLTGIISATGSFLERNTSFDAFHIASKLLEKDVPHSDIIEHLFKMKSLRTLKLWGKVMGNLEVDPLHRIAWSSVNKAEFSFLECSFLDIDTISSDLLRHINGVDLTVLFLEEEKKTIIQLRIATPSISPQEVQAFLGGGGNIVPFGLDFDIPKKSLVEVEFEFLKLLLFFQKKRLGIPKDLEIQKMEITPLENIEPSLKTEKQISNKKPTISSVPENPPFELLSQNKNGADFVKKENSKNPSVILEDVPEEERNNIPAWLKK